MSQLKINEYINSLEVIIYDLRESIEDNYFDEDDREQEEFRLKWFEDELDKLYDIQEFYDE